MRLELTIDGTLVTAWDQQQNTGMSIDMAELAIVVTLKGYQRPIPREAILSNGNRMVQKLIEIHERIDEFSPMEGDSVYGASGYLTQIHGIKRDMKDLIRILYSSSIKIPVEPIKFRGTRKITLTD